MQSFTHKIKYKAFIELIYFTILNNIFRKYSLIKRMLHTQQHSLQNRYSTLKIEFLRYFKQDSQRSHVDKILVVHTFPTQATILRKLQTQFKKATPSHTSMNPTFSYMSNITSVVYITPLTLKSYYICMRRQCAPQ